jgi:hypothetical protein
MQSINNGDILNYDGKTRLAPAVSFDYDAGSKVLTIADDSVYPSGDSRKQINVCVYDKFGGKIEKSFTEEGDYLQDSESSDGVAKSFGIDLQTLNLTEGVAVSATVVSTVGRTSTGSVHDVVTLKTTGTLQMQK